MKENMLKYGKYKPRTSADNTQTTIKEQAQMGFIDIVKQNREQDKKTLENVKKMPYPRIKGTLKLREKGNSKQIYMKLQGESKYTYVSKTDDSNREKVNRLRQKSFIDTSRRILEADIALQEYFIENYIPYTTENICKHQPHAYRQDEPKANFKQADRQSQNPYKREQLIHGTLAGIKVRSKGELLIADALTQIGVDYYYEKELRLTDEDGMQHTLYPDFTIPLKNAEIFYWEHEGLYGDPEYRRRSNEKKKLYFANCIYVPKNLIVTMDGPDGSIDSEGILRVIQGIILPLL